MQGNTVITDSIRRKIEELRKHAIEEGENLDAEVKLDSEPQASWSLKAKLTHKPGDASMWIVTSNQDWEHDAIDDVLIIPGTIYASDEPFLPDSIILNGYFQADEDGRWVRVTNGCVPWSEDDANSAWKNALDEFPEVVDELNEAMAIPEYQHMAEKAAMQQARRERWGAYSIR